MKDINRNTSYIVIVEGIEKEGFAYRTHKEALRGFARLKRTAKKMSARDGFNRVVELATRTWIGGN